MSTDDRTPGTAYPGTAYPGPAYPGPVRGNPGRTLLISVSGLLLASAVAVPAFAYVQASPDGEPVDVHGAATAASVRISADRAEIDIVPATGDEIEWTIASDRPSTAVDVEESGDAVDIDVHSVGSLWQNLGPSLDIDWVGWSSRSTRVTVAIPEGTDVVIDSDFGDVDATDVAFGDLGVDADFGSVRLSGSAEDLDLTLDYGNVTGHDLAATGEIDILASFGDVDLRSPEVPAGVSVEADFGDVTIALPPGPYAVSHSADLGEASNDLTIEPGELVVPVTLHTSLGSVRAETY